MFALYSVPEMGSSLIFNFKYSYYIQNVVYKFVSNLRMIKKRKRKNLPKRQKKEGMGGRWNGECGLRPLRAVGSIYEPEAVGAIGAYAPEGRRNLSIWDLGMGN
jgi:hypothetical protein